MRVPRLALVAMALLLLASAVTAGFALRGSVAARDGCDAEAAAEGRCATASCNPERPACQEQQRNERLRRHCAEHPRDARCQ